MSKIIIGTGGGAPGKQKIGLDLDLLLSTRMLVTADSGGGKTFLLKRICEQAASKIQIIIIDPEGEFSPLRERFPFVLAGKGGETPADVRSAQKLGLTLLQTRASAVCDLYEMKSSERHEWVRLFLEALLEAPKNLRHPCIVIVDEAHLFCPEKGKGESAASDAMKGLCTRGRKRLLCPLFATQRLAELDKGASGMLNNRLIGPTFEDVNRKRAAEILSVVSEELPEFKKKIQMLEPGYFYALGRAICKERTLLRVGGIETPHGEEARKYELEPPPPPEKIKALLPKLADLPKAAEEEARTTAQFRKEIRELKAQLRAQPKPIQVPAKHAVVKTDPGLVAKMAAKAAAPLRAALEECMKIVAKIEAVGFEKSNLDASEVKAILERTADQIAKSVNHSLLVRAQELIGLRRQASQLRARMQKLLDEKKELQLDISVRHQEPAAISVKVEHASAVTRPREVVAPPDGFSAAQVKILSRLVELLECTGAESLRKEQLAAWAEYSPNSGGFNNYLGALRSAGLIDYPSGGMVAITEAGRRIARPDDAPVNSGEMLERAKRVLGGSEARILEELHRRHPEACGKIELAEATGFSPNSGGFNNYLGHMRTRGFIEYPGKGAVRCADWLFIE